MLKPGTRSSSTGSLLSQQVRSAGRTIGWLLVAAMALRFLQFGAAERGTLLFWVLEIGRYALFASAFVVAWGVIMELTLRLDRIVRSLYDDR